MRYILFLLTLIFCDNVLANPVRVAGYGASYDEAKKDGFRKAIEYKVGSMILSETERRNYELVRNDLIIYSSGYVTNFKVIERRNNPEVKLLMDVWVEEKNIIQRLTSVSSTVSEFDGELHSAQIESIIDRKQQADKLLDSVLKDYPHRAYILKQYAYNIDISNVSRPILKVNFSLEWNPGYILSLQETLSIIQEKDKGELISISGLKRFSFGKNFYFDKGTINTFWLSFSNANHATVKLKILDRYENVLKERCFMPYQMYRYYDFNINQLYIYSTNVVVQAVSTDIINIKNIDKINLSIVAAKDCKNTL